MHGAACSATLVHEVLKPEFDVEVLTASNVGSAPCVHELRLGPQRAAIPMLLRLPMGMTGIAQQVERILDRVQPDLIHLQDTDLVDPVIPLAERRRIPVIVTLRDIRYVSSLGWKAGATKGASRLGIWDETQSFLSMMEWRRPVSWCLPFFLPWLYAKPARVRALLERANLLLPVSQFLKDSIRSFGISGTCQVLKLAPVPDWPALPLHEPPSSRFLYVGRLVRGKGPGVLIRSFQRVLRRLPEARLQLAGDGPQRKALQRLARGLGCANRVEFLGHIPFDALPSLYESADIVVVPSVEPEALSRVAAEAAVVGRPVIASRAGGLPEVLGEDGGVLCQPGDSAELAEQMVSLATDRSRQQEIVRNARARAAVFSFSHLRAELSAIYESVLRRE